METQLTKITSALGNFKDYLDRQGFVSPMLGALEPKEKLRRSSNNQEIFGYILEGDMSVISNAQVCAYAKYEIFFIDGENDFEIHAGMKGVEYLFAFKNKHEHV